MENFKTFFEQNYKGNLAFVESIIKPVFGNEFTSSHEDILQSNPNYKSAAERANIQSIIRFGICELEVPLQFFDITLYNHVQLNYSRVHIQALIRQLMETYSAAIIVFHYPNNQGEWRVSYVSKGSNAADATSAKRYTYLLGENLSCRTAAERLDWLKGKDKTLKNITEAFSVEVLTKQFYIELFDWYQWALSDNDGFAVTYPNDISTEEDDRNIDEHLIRLITRLMFVWFIKQKKLVPENIFKIEELQNLLNNFDPISKDSGNYYNAILQNLFFATLNKPINEREFATEVSFQGKDKHFGIKTLFRNDKNTSWFKQSNENIIHIFKQVPFLNGGLFECLDKENADGKVFYYDGFSRMAGRQKRAFLPNCLFFDTKKGLIPLLEKYNFTVEENTPTDLEVALDPELLGKVFENLLGAYNPETKEIVQRKKSGSFYTPREIVNYMVDESLIAYLSNSCPDIEEDTIRQLFIQDYLPAELLQSTEKRNRLVTKIKAAKMLDPACGSGAFPMGMLNRMVDLIRKLQTETKINVYDLKRYLIENCIYGIDIQTIAVQITKLRFFISLICEQTPTENINDNYGIKSLPNLEAKFVAANTLIGLNQVSKEQLDLRDEELVQMKEELWDIRCHKNFSADTWQQKINLRKQDKELCKKIENYLLNNATKADTEKIERNKLLISDLQKERELLIEEWIDETELPKVQFSIFGETQPAQPSIFRKDKNKAKRDEIDERIKRLTKEIETENKKTELTGIEADIRLMINWDPYNQNASSLFFDAEWMFGIKDGFDMVIGNPPYIKEYTYKDAFEGVRTSPYYQGKMDLWYLFACTNLDMTKSKSGLLCFIATNNWTTNAGASKMRAKVLNDTTIHFLLDFGSYMIFESADIQTMVMLFRNDNSNDNYNFELRKLVGTSIIFDDVLDLIAKKETENSVFLSPVISKTNLLNKPLTFSTDIISVLLQKIKTKHNFIIDSKKEIAQGIVPNPDVVNKKNILKIPTNRILKENIKVGDGVFITDKGYFSILSPNESKYIKPIYEPYLIDKYSINKYDKEIIYITKKNYKNDAPKLISHLEKFREIMEDRRENQQGKLGFNHLHWPREECFFESGEKILSVRKCRVPTFAYTVAESYVMMSFNVIRSKRINLKYLTAILNSKLIEFWLRNKGKMQGNNFQLDKEPLLEIPIFKANEKEITKITQNVDQILSTKAGNPKADTSDLEKQIDELVYKLYELTYEEVKIIEPAFALTKEEYMSYE